MLTAIARILCPFPKICFRFSTEGEMLHSLSFCDYFPTFVLHILPQWRITFCPQSDLSGIPTLLCCNHLAEQATSIYQAGPRDRRTDYSFLKYLGYSPEDSEGSDSWTVWSIQTEMLLKRNYHPIILFFPETQSMRNNVILYSIMQKIEHYSHKTSHCLVPDKNY